MGLNGLTQQNWILGSTIWQKKKKCRVVLSCEMMRSSHNISCLRQIKDSLTSVLLLHITFACTTTTHILLFGETSNCSLSQDLNI